MRTAVIADEVFEHHVSSAGHPERPERTAELRAALAKGALARVLKRIPPREAPPEQIALVHDDGYVQGVARMCGAGGGLLDAGDTWVGPASYGVAACAVGAVLQAVDAVAEGMAEAVFCAVRPPGHHALRDRAMGFCVFNNVAVGAAYATRLLGMDRVFILDWDVHHGNGTQALFYRDPCVFYCSLHRWPYYPGTGAETEVGEAGGAGYTLNLPLRPHADEAVYRAAMEARVLPILEQFQPQLLMISAGFDAHRLDPLGGMCLESESFGLITRLVVSATKAPVVSVLEGGYHLEALRQSVHAHLLALTAWEGEE
jgi:acetoin utilization deacetylase AcuC-like enzyme